MTSSIGNLALQVGRSIWKSVSTPPTGSKAVRIAASLAKKARSGWSPRFDSKDKIGPYPILNERRSKTNAYDIRVEFGSLIDGEDSNKQQLKGESDDPSEDAKPTKKIVQIVSFMKNIMGLSRKENNVAE